MTTISNAQKKKKLGLFKKARGPENLGFFYQWAKKPFVGEISNFFYSWLVKKIFCCPYSAGYRVNENFLLSYQSIKWNKYSSGRI